MTLSVAKLKELRRRAISNGNRIADAVELADTTQAALAQATGFTAQYVNDVVRGRYDTITVDNAHKFAEYFGCAIEDLFPSREAVA